MNNAYPELPSVPYERTAVEMWQVQNHIRSVPVDPEVQRAAYIMFRVESANGTKGVNQNYCGMQADGSRWPESLTHYFSGVAVEPENGTGRMRLFLAFARWEDCVDCLMDRVKARGLYIGAKALPISHLLVTDETSLVRAYTKEWAQGRADAEPSPDTIAAWHSMYGQAMALFRHGHVAPVPAPAPAPAAVDTDNSADALMAVEQQQLDQGTQA